MSQNHIPIWNKYCITIEEAAVYFRLGENKLRVLINSNPTAEYILWNGNRAQIKRELFEKFLNKQNAI